jgi:hypothetical protein
MDGQDMNDPASNVKLRISFPVSNEDHRLQLVEINGAIVAILHAPLKSNGPIKLHCQDWSLVLLAPIVSKSDVEISAINIICLNEIQSEEGSINIQASNHLVELTPCIKPSEKILAWGKCGEHRYGDDPGTFLKYFQLYNKVVQGARDTTPSASTEAQQNFLLSLCALANKITGKTEGLNIHSVLDFWDIPGLI